MGVRPVVSAVKARGTLSYLIAMLGGLVMAIFFVSCGGGGGSDAPMAPITVVASGGDNSFTITGAAGECQELGPRCSKDSQEPNPLVPEALRCGHWRGYACFTNTLAFTPDCST